MKMGHLKGVFLYMPNASIKSGVNAVFLRFIAQSSKDVCNINNSLRDTPTGMQ